MDANSIYLGLSRQMGLSGRINTVANNVANANTAGYMAQRVSFEGAQREVSDAVVGNPMGAGEADFPLDRSTYLDAGGGSMRKTGNPMDVAIDGSGFLAVRGENGDQLLTRNGQMKTDANGVLIHAPSGQPVLNQNGGQIVLPEAGQDVRITRDGGIVGADGAVIGQLGAFEVPRSGLVEPRGRALYAANQASGQPAPAQNSAIKQGYVESSNVEPVKQLTTLIKAQRAYGRVDSMKSTVDEQLTQTIRTLGQTT